MSSVIEILTSKKKPQVAPSTLLLPVLQKGHEGECGDGCRCGNTADGGCCGE